MKAEYTKYSRSNYNLIVGILSDAGFFTNLNNMKRGEILVTDISGVTDLLMAVWNHVSQFKGTVTVFRTSNEKIVSIMVL